MAREGSRGNEGGGGGSAIKATEVKEDPNIAINASNKQSVTSIAKVLAEAALTTKLEAEKAKGKSEVSTKKYTDSVEKQTGDKSDVAKITDKSATKLKEETPEDIFEEYKKTQTQIIKDKTALAEQQIAQASQLSQWYSGLNKSYEDIASRYNNAIVGLGDSERQKMQGQAQQDYMANSALGARAASMPGQGRMQTGAQLQLQQAAGAQGASSAYASAQQRMMEIDQQRREMQYSVVNSSLQQELSSKTAGYSMQAGQIGLQQGIQNNLMNTRENMANQQYGAQVGAYNTNMSNFQQGTQARLTGAQNMMAASSGQAQQSFNYSMAGNEAMTNAATYAPTANMGLNTQQQQYDLANRGIEVGMQNVSMQQQASQNQLLGSFITGGATLAGAYFMGPGGAMAGNAAGQGINASMNNRNAFV